MRTGDFSGGTPRAGAGPHSAGRQRGTRSARALPLLLLLGSFAAGCAGAQEEHIFRATCTAGGYTFTLKEKRFNGLLIRSDAILFAREATSEQSSLVYEAISVRGSVQADSEFCKADKQTSILSIDFRRFSAAEESIKSRKLGAWVLKFQ